MKDCLTIMCKLFQICASFSDDLICEENSVEKSARKCDTAVAIAFLEIGKNTSIAMQKLITIVSSSINDLYNMHIYIYVFICVYGH